MKRVFLLLFLLPLLAAAQQILPRPASGYVQDRAGLITPEAIAQINAISAGTWRTVHAPIAVATIPSLSSVGAYSVESYAVALFNAWGVGDREYNRGILVLVARDDRRARIEMGKGWGYDKDDQCQQIMDGWMIPNFKQENYSDGILKGVQALDSLVRDGKLPRKPWPPWVLPAIIVGVVFLLLLTIDLARHGMDGWAGALLRWIGQSLSNSMTYGGRYRRGYWDYDNDSGWSGWGGGGGGGGFGGGSSGGGGASGSW